MAPDDDAPFDAEPRVERRRLRFAAGIAGGVALVALAAGWIERKPIVRHFVDRSLVSARVPASYRITSLGPFRQRLENVRLGDPAHPDLVARRIDLALGYGINGPYVRAVRMEGGQLRARIVDGRLSLGSIDRLLPASKPGAPFALPEIDATLVESRIALETPVGPIVARIDGAGGLANGFRGRLNGLAPMLAIAGCRAERVTADIAVAIDRAAPHLTGPLAIGAVRCSNATLGLGKVAADLRFDTTLTHVSGAIRPSGFAGRAAGVKFGAVQGVASLEGSVAKLEGLAELAVVGVRAAAGQADRASLLGHYVLAMGGRSSFAGDVRMAGAALPAGRRKAIADLGRSLAGTPLGPIAARVGEAVATLAAHADISATIAATMGGDQGADITLQRLSITGREGATVAITQGAGIGWSARGLHLDGTVRTSGGGLPEITARLHQTAPGAPVDGIATMAPYTAGAARVALAPVRFSRDARTTRIDTVATLDGPLGDGRVEGLRVPIAGNLLADGSMRFGAGCIPISFQRLTIAGAMLDPARFAACGSPVLATDAGGRTRLDLRVANPRFIGRIGSGPLTLSANAITARQSGFRIEGLSARIGADDRVTRLDVGMIDGAFVAGPSGHFAGADGQIANVPLLLKGGAGEWRVAGGALALTGTLGVSDADPAPRLRPLIARDVKLDLVDSRIVATGMLIEPTRQARVAEVRILHDLRSGSGQATLAVPGITFARKGLQPDMLTPLTLGVVANVAGTVAGDGRIDWAPQGVTSTGDFHTDRIDLAAAFGPVEGIAGAIHFSDLLGLVTPPHQRATIAAINPGVVVADGIAHYRLAGNNRVEVEEAHWPFAGGALVLEPTMLDFSQSAERRMTFRITGLDAAAFVQQLDFPNIAATGTIDGVLPMLFDQQGGRIVGGALRARGPGTLAYVGELSNAQLGTMGKLAFDALKAIRYKALAIDLDGRLDGEMVTRVRFEGVRQATGERTFVQRLIRNLPFRFNIEIRAPFRGLIGSARTFADPSLLLLQLPQPAVQPAASGAMPKESH